MSIKQFPGGIITKNPTAPTGPYETGAAPGIWTLDQAMNYKKQGIWPIAGNAAPPTVIGQAYGGGFYAGQIGVSSVATHYLVVGPVASAESTLQWKNAPTATPGADSVINGPQNTADMVADGGSAVYPCAHFCNDLSTGGQTDWYMPAKNELEVCYYNLKPTTQSNSTASGINANAVPARASNYTAGTPAQTSATAFITSTGAEAFTAVNYWSSTEWSDAKAWRQGFYNGGQGFAYKYYSFKVRAIRRVAV
jgi:hypothetical protein